MARSAGGRTLVRGTEKATNASEHLEHLIECREMSCSAVETIDEDEAKQVAETLREAADMIEAGADSMRY
ncbi:MULTISPECIES: hypothetical protein [Haloferacaceae]|uniref:Uncharacterized protein n=2 Tax=Haloferacaceae TaxID=1644056 RepID=A0ABD6DBV8_9EURY|nr:MULTISPECIES: hypothetical protein [Halorubraceae]